MVIGRKTKVDVAQRATGDERWSKKRDQDGWLRRTTNNVRIACLKRLADTAPLTLVTGASDNHAAPLMRFLRSALDHEPQSGVVVYDLGLSHADRDRISEHFPLRKFEFSAFPSYFDITQNQGQYAWKPTIIKKVADERPGHVICWMDAGHIIVEHLDDLRAAVAYNGFYSAIDYWYFGDWIHPGMLEFFQLGPDWRYWNWTLTAGAVAFDTRRSKAMRLLDDWARYSAVEACIAPAGSNRANHRQDQALLTLLAYRSGMVPLLAPTKLGFRNKQDSQTGWPTL